jgi:putative FmdB family regulatory protein
MPIYEFYCGRCNTVFNFFSRTVDTEKIPNCPRCKTVPLKRQMSIFAKISAGKTEGDDEPLPFDEARMEKAMAMLAAEADKVNEDDPRGAARLMRKLTDATGLSLGAGMEEALARMERGEDPDRIEQEMGERLEGEEPFLMEAKGSRGARRGRPQTDDTLYEL